MPESRVLLRGALLDWAAQGGELTDESCQAWLEEHGLQDLTEALLAGPLPREVGSKRENDDVLKVEIIESWWPFYGLVIFDSFER